MPAILNLKFKGNKSFVPFSNLSDADSLTKTWKVCTKVASFLEQGQRLENLSWRLWHLQNLMVDSDNAKSKRDFKKLSKFMSDKLDKEKGRSIEELQAPDFKRNHSTDLLQQRALEKEREREASQNGRTIHRMQFTFSVDQPSAISASSVPAKKPDLKPSPEFKDNKRGRPTTRSSTTGNTSEDSTVKDNPNEKDQPLTQRGRKPSAANGDDAKEDMYRTAALRFPSLFSNDFGPSALLYPTPTVTNPMTYGEGVGLSSSAASDGFSIPRPTIELPLDELLNADSPGGWNSGGYNHSDSRQTDSLDSQEDVEMKVTPHEASYPSHAARAEPAAEDEGLLKSTALRNVPPLNNVEDVVPRTITPSRIGPSSGPGASTDTKPSSGKRPSLSVRTQVSTRSTGPSATPVNSSQQNSNSNSAPGGVKAECSNCGATHTPLWRRGLNDELNCNACGLYCKLHKRPRPKSMRNAHGEGRTQSAPRQESQEVVAQCYNCHTTATPLWRKDDEGKTVCNACGLYYKLHGSARPISMKSDVIRKRARHDARRAGNSVSETPSASPGASRRASPNAEPTPTLAPDSSTATQSSVTNANEGHQNSGGNGSSTEYRTSMQSELMGALGTNEGNGMQYNSQMFGSSVTYFPGPYHPDYLSQIYSVPSEPLPFSSGDNSDDSGSESRSSKRRRLSNDSASEPPSSAVSFSSYSESYSSSSSTSQRSSADFPFSPYSSFSSMLRGSSNPTWHPPMLPPDNSPQFIHPPMLPPSEDSPMFFHQQGMQSDDTDALFAAYLHPPMVPQDDSPSMSSLQLHPPMLPSEWKVPGQTDMYDHSQMVTY